MKKSVWLTEVATVALGLLALIGAMSGCGAVETEMNDTAPTDGGGGRPGSRENDETLPAVDEEVPADGATKVPINTTIRLRFSEPMDAESLASAFTVSLDLPIDGLVRYDESTDTVIFTPAEDLRAGKVYTTSITTDARDAAGNPIESPRSWSFTTEELLYRVSVRSDGQEGDGHSYDCSGCVAVSGDGRYTVDLSGATNLVGDDTNGLIDVFRHDWQSGATIRVNVPDAADRDKLGHEGNGEAESPSVSADGRYVAFASEATNLVADDTNGESDIFVHDAETGATTLVSIPNSRDRDSLGILADGESARPRLNADGRFVVFESSATNLVVGDDNDEPDVFVHDRQTGTTEMVSGSATGVPGNDRSRSGSISGDGRYVVFASDASNLDSQTADTNEDSDIYVRDRSTGTTTRITMAYDGGETETRFAVSSHAPSISEDGRYVVFTSLAHNLVEGDTNDESDVFVHDRETGTTKRVNVPSLADQEALGSESNDQSRLAEISDDGRYVAFVSLASNLASSDTNGDFDIFVHDTHDGLTRRVSLAADGTQIEIERLQPPNVTSPPVSMSADGRYVVFSTDSALVVEGDENGASDVFRVLNAPLPNTPDPRCPDLTVSTFQLHGEQSIRVGELLRPRLEFLFENVGKRTAEEFSFSVYLSEDDEITEDDLWLATFFPSPLAPGEAERLQVDSAVKQGLPNGPVWIGVIIDARGDLAECDEENNVAAIPVVLGCRDLAPASFDLLGDSWARPGDTIGDRLAAAVENLGDLPTGGLGFEVNFYISEDANITRGDRMLFSARKFFAGSLGAGEQDDGSVDPSAWIPPDWPLGPAYLGMLVDELDAIDECDENNNTAAIAFTIADQARSDIVATDFTLSGGSTVSLGESLESRLAASVQNIGAAPTVGFVSGIYLSSDELLDGSDLRIGGLYTIGRGLSGGGSHELRLANTNKQMPDRWPSDEAYLLFYADVRWENVESARDNNWLAIPVTVQ